MSGQKEAHEAAQGNELANAISAVDCIMFGVTIDDHFDRLEWMQAWIEGRWGEMRRNYPEYAAGKWRVR